MSRLAELQLAFQQTLLDPPGDLTQPWVRAGGRAPPARQLSAYVHAYPARLKEVLGNDYPALLMAIGDEPFDRLAQAYLETHPSHYFSLRDFGGRLAEFIAAQAACRELPWLVELARFEWALGRAFDAADTPVAAIGDMAVVPPDDWPGLRFEIHPSVQRLDFDWNTPGIWAALTADEPQAVTASEAAAVPWLVWREQLTTRFRSLPADEQVALDCLCGGGDFGQACERLAAFVDADAVPLRAASLLKGWITRGLITAVHSPDRRQANAPGPPRPGLR